MMLPSSSYSHFSCSGLGRTMLVRFCRWEPARRPAALCSHSMLMCAAGSRPGALLGTAEAGGLLCAESAPARASCGYVWRSAEDHGELRRSTESCGGARQAEEEHAELLRQGARLCFRLLRRGANWSCKSSKGWLDPRAGLGWLGSWTVACPAFIYN